jgi:hypothetical protein
LLAAISRDRSRLALTGLGRPIGSQKAGTALG